MHLRTENFSLKTDTGKTLKLNFKTTEIHVNTMREEGFTLHALYRSFKINNRYVPAHRVQCKTDGLYIVNFTNPTRCLYWFAGARRTPGSHEDRINHGDYARGQKIDLIYDARYLYIYIDILKGAAYKKIRISFLCDQRRVYVGQDIGKISRGSRFKLKGHDSTIDLFRIPDQENIKTQ